MLDALSVGQARHFSLFKGVIKFKNCIWLDHDKQLQELVMNALHVSPIGGQSGDLVTYQMIKKLFYWSLMWSLMKQQIYKFVASCSVCQQAKTEKVHYLGLLQPLPVPAQAWHTITLDFIEGLPKSGGYDCVLVVVENSLSTLILSSSAIHSQHSRWQNCLWSTSISYMECQWP